MSFLVFFVNDIDKPVMHVNGYILDNFHSLIKTNPTI